MFSEQRFHHLSKELWKNVSMALKTSSNDETLAWLLKLKRCENRVKQEATFCHHHHTSYVLYRT